MTTGMMILKRAYLSPSSKVCTTVVSDERITETALIMLFVALEKTTPEEEKPEVDDPGKTIRPTRSPAGPSNIPLPPLPDSVPTVEDWSDLAAGEDEQKLEDKVAGFKVFFISVFLKSQSLDVANV